MAQNHEPAEELNTWQEIADHLKVSVRTAQNYEKVGLPVRRVPGGRGRVIAFKGALSRWKADRLSPGGLGNGQAPEWPLETPSRQQTTAAEGVATDRPEAGPAAVTAAPAAQDIRAKMSRPLIVAAAVTVLVMVMVGSRYLWHRRVPVAYKTEVSTLITVDGEGREVWRHHFPRPFSDHAYEGEAKIRRGVLADLDNTGKIETLFTYVLVDWESRGSELFCLSQDGKQEWSFIPGRPVVTGLSYYPPYTTNGVLVIKNPQDGESRVVVSSNHHIDAPNQVAVLNGSGKLVGEFWHPGHLRQMAHADLNGDGKEKLLLAGVNNAYHAATLLVFDPRNVQGSSVVKGAPTPEFGLQGFAPGAEQAMLLFPRTCLSRHKPYNRVGNLSVRGGRIYVLVSEDTDEASPAAIIYTLDFSLNVLAADPLPGYQEAHRQKYRAGELDHELTRKEMEGWKKAVVIKRQ